MTDWGLEKRIDDIVLTEHVYMILVSDIDYEMDRLLIVALKQFEPIIIFSLKLLADRLILDNVDEYTMCTGITIKDYEIYRIAKINRFSTYDLPDMLGTLRIENRLTFIDRVFSVIKNREEIGQIQEQAQILDDFLSYSIRMSALENENKIKLATYYGRYDDVNLLIFNGHYTVNIGLYYASINGSMPIVKLLLDNHATKIKEGLAGACEGGHLELINLFVERGARNFNEGLYYATMGGHLAAINRMHELGANDMNVGLYGAVVGNHFDLVDFYLKNGANDIESALKKAAMYASSKMVQYIIDRGAKNFNRAATAAASNNRYRNLELLLNYGPNNFNDMLSVSSKNGHLDTIILVLARGANDISTAYYKAGSHAQKDVIKYLSEHGYRSVQDLNQGLYGAAKNNDPVLVIYLLDIGAIDINGALIVAKYNECTEVITLLEGRIN